jgi:mRNA-degrading endonuclease YafQ of YafQ-DinJ toxin-antitoxin module
MVILVYGKLFLKSAKQLPLLQQKKLAKLLSCFQKDPFNPLLHTKRLTGSLIGFLSFRITRDWRVMF